jgi:hypothetical protein
LYMDCRISTETLRSHRNIDKEVVYIPI